jgi:hypothetical protein
MFELEEIELLLSAQAKNMFADIDLFKQLSSSTTEIIINYTHINKEDKPEWAKIPFVFIIEYLAANRINATSPERLKLIQTNYETALLLLKDNINTQFIAGKTGSIGGLYDVDI